jgi:hypothetical protein
MFKNLSNEEIIELYKKTSEFVNYLEKEINNIEKLRDDND